MKEHISILVGRYSWMFVKLVPTLMIDDAETKMRTEVAVLFELKHRYHFVTPHVSKINYSLEFELLGK
jgi:hypothetical protein